MSFSETEREVIFLKAVKELIDEMVNYEVFDLNGSDPESQIMFHSITHQRFFNIILVDFLSCSDKKVIGEQQSYLSAIRSICQSPSFNEGESINNLVLATDRFIDWLEQEVQVETWLPSIETNAVLSIKRIEFLKICGNISKHNFSRLSGAVNELIKIFKRNNVDIDLEKSLLVLNEFYERFHTDILNYHSSTIAEFLNNIRWGIYEYLQPEFCRSIVWESKNPPIYKYTYPLDIKNEFAKSCYWELMNEMRSVPYIRRFQVTKWLKLRY
ncbi:hypothetical protein [Coleofasciculus sp. FACHB-SPT9]|nr:hypothetical protein [Coleofasciculus sp. FACHB-SPT9]